MRYTLFAAVAAASLIVAGAASAATMNYMATLKGSDEVPANATTGTGMVMASLDTASKAFTYTVTYSGLTGPAVAAHFHGPAEPGKNAGPTVPLTAISDGVKGKATLTDAQIADLNAGKWYFNIHTAANPGGEIRGQVMAMK